MISFLRTVAILTITLISFILIDAAPLFAFQDGEKLTFNINYGIISAGQATLEIKEIDFREDTPAYQITSTARTNRFFDRIFKVRDEIESIMDRESLTSHRFTKRLREGRYRQHRIHFYYPEQEFSIYMRYSFPIESFRKKEWKSRQILRIFFQPFTGCEPRS